MVREPVDDVDLEAVALLPDDEGTRRHPVHGHGRTSESVGGKVCVRDRQVRDRADGGTGVERELEGDEHGRGEELVRRHPEYLGATGNRWKPRGRQVDEGEGPRIEKEIGSKDMLGR